MVAFCFDVIILRMMFVMLTLRFWHDKHSQLVTVRRKRISIRNKEEHFSDRVNYIHTIIFSLFLLLVI